ncbi:TadE/TadG family type IV pilus assembly protein [Chthonobacter rhizosphaerae]|uniref:TadE/TadG family type IV pilus assembly protein n=1 Tax=Chthonobacter rhizosphaerae TaxID=2735553 RepID=UPI0015EEFB68|nr:pilus assembly protein TadG-related protein [Chthonobacter rhizosphaerae]
MVEATRFKVISSFRQSTAGSVIVGFAVALPVLALSVAAAVEYGSLKSTRTVMQAAADSAALAGAEAIARSSPNDSTRIQKAMQAASAYASANAPSAASTITVDEAQNIVQVNLRTARTLFFGGIFGNSQSEVAVVSKAVAAGSQIACILATAPTGNAIKLDGNSSVTASDCNVWSNSSAAPSMSFSGGSSTRAKEICAVGTYSATASVSPTPKSGCKALSDPFASVDLTNLGTACDYGAINVPASITWNLNPGVYCGAITIEGLVNLSPGIYVFKDISLAIRGKARVTGNEVSMLLLGTSTAVWTGQAKLALTATKSGPLSGITVAGATSNNTVSLSGSLDTATGEQLDVKSTGSIYLRASHLSLSGHTKLSMNGESSIVANTIAVGGNALLSLASTKSVVVNEARLSR